MSLTLLLFKIKKFITKKKNQAFQPLQGPYLRVINMKFQCVCSRQCKTYHVKVQKGKNKKKKLP